MNLVQSPARPCVGLAETVIDLSVVRDNVKTLSKRIRPGTEIMAIVKADGFNHGAAQIATAAIEAGATWLGVARAEEALQLRAAGLTEPIMIWLYDASELLLLKDIDVSVSTVAELQQIASAPNVHNVHLKLDTGMHRGGSAPDQWIELTRTAAHYEALGTLRIRGIWSHLSHGDEPDASHSTRQLQLLRTGVALARRAGLTPDFVHLANSSGALTLDAPDCNMVRIGAGLFGIDEVDAGLRQPMQFVTKVVQVRRIRAGEGVSYGHDFIAERDTTVALIPIGYADGVPRIAGAQASVLVRGVRLPVVGRITMDQFVVDAGDLPIEVGTPVIVFGNGDAGEPTAADWADWAGTIPHEIYCGLGTRVPRRYVEGTQR
ncbi:alanine racemase [Streptomyces sp. SID13031]|uniref:alanine racemase n=1 Tax=Streptomyces sp. SID13031 TaxID=2706046 RepID=UPI0013CC4556|nr:alanine racemase [Streptomyces sp. SID13031]NEA34939.1 alanine racemase [Streptomyces sp. SID13031]